MTLCWPGIVRGTRGKRDTGDGTATPRRNGADTELVWACERIDHGAARETLVTSSVAWSLSSASVASGGVCPSLRAGHLVFVAPSLNLPLAVTSGGSSPLRPTVNDGLNTKQPTTDKR